MKHIRISEATHRAIAEASILRFQSAGERLPDGTWLVAIEDDTYERLKSHRLPGETDDDTIARMLHASHGRPSH
jgi:hypothetical protein